MADEQQKCSRCESDLDTDGYPLWCKACRAKYNREYRDLQRQMGDGRGFLAGVEAFRRAALEKLAAMPPGGMLRVFETSRWLQDLPAPKPKT